MENTILLIQDLDSVSAESVSLIVDILNKKNISKPEYLFFLELYKNIRANCIQNKASLYIALLDYRDGKNKNLLKFCSFIKTES